MLSFAGCQTSCNRTTSMSNLCSICRSKKREVLTLWMLFYKSFVSVFEGWTDRTWRQVVAHTIEVTFMIAAPCNSNITTKDNILITDALFQFIFWISMKLWCYRCWFTLWDVVIPRLLHVADSPWFYVGVYYQLILLHCKFYNPAATLHVVGSIGSKEEEGQC